MTISKQTVLSDIQLCICLLQIQPKRAVLLKRCSFNIWRSYWNFSKIVKTYLRRNSKVVAYSLYKKQTPSQIFLKTSLKLPKLLFFSASHWWLLLLLDKNIRYYQRCIKQTPPGQFSILINDSDLREFDLHATLKKTALKGQKLIVRATLCYLTKNKDSKLIFRYCCNNFRIFLSH